MPPIARDAAKSIACADSPADSLFALSTQRDLIAEMLELSRPADVKDQPRVSELADRIEALNRELGERTANSCAELQSISAGLDSVLQLAELQSEKTEEAYGLYCLLKLLKLQLDSAVDDVHRML